MDDLKNIRSFRIRFGSCYAERKRVMETARMTVRLEECGPSLKTPIRRDMYKKQKAGEPNCVKGGLF